MTILSKVNWRNIKTLTIKNCNPTTCHFEKCPLHAGNANNPFPLRDQAQEAGPGVTVISCNQNPLLARALMAFAGQLQKKKGAAQHGHLERHV